MPHPDLHRHLDGSLRAATLAELADPLGLQVPADLPFAPGMGLMAALSRFAFTLSTLQGPEAVRRVAAECAEDALLEGVDPFELRFAPQLHRGAAPEEIVDAALDGLAGRGGLLLCGLYGEPPTVLDQLVAIAATRPGVVGIDLAGGPAAGHRFGLRDYAPAFTRARDLGIGRTVHAGEGRPAAEIGEAIVHLHAQRIGHGTTLLEDPTVLDQVLEGGITIEACPTSNWHTGVISAVEAHPLPRWLALGVRVCVNADNTLLSGVTAADELRTMAALPGVGDAGVARLIEYGRAAAFRRA
jgi:adenosine deaminase